MTVAVAVKVFDGLVLAADSATTMELGNGSHQVYNNANKIFHLHRRKPIAAVTWGMGSIDAASISTIAKDLRRRFMGLDPAYMAWELDDAYTVEAVANRMLEMFYDELYVPAYSPTVRPGDLGLLVAGYSSGESHPEAWLLVLDDTTIRPVPQLHIAQSNYGWGSFAQPEATERLFNGVDSSVQAAIESVLPPEEWAKVEPILRGAMRNPAVAPMPFADAAALAKFLVEVTVGYSHVLLGPDTVGGPIEIAGLNRHEGFKWISRKHYYDQTLNPWEPRHDL